MHIITDDSPPLDDDDYDHSMCPVCDGTHPHNHTTAEYEAALGAFDESFWDRLELQKECR